MQEQNEIQKELEALGSTLGKVPRRMPYALPEGYFGELPRRMLAAALDQEIVAELTKATPFEVPAQYFERLPAQLLEAVRKDETQTVKTIPLWRRLWLQSRLAAAAVLFLLAGAGVFRIAFQKDTIDRKIAALPEEALTEYISQTSSELTAGSSAATANAMLPVQLTEEEITAYLDQTGWQ